MNQDFYLNRTLNADDKHYDENQLLSSHKYIVVLAEPGAGKTALLNSFATKLATKVVTATTFSYKTKTKKGQSLVIDAFDEMAKVSDEAIYKLLAKIAETEPSYLIVASRSSEWSESVTHYFVEFIENSPTIVRLKEFSQSEQQAIYEHHTNNDDFTDFYHEIDKFSLLPLLPNPLFLKLFADAYSESHGHFKDRCSIFSHAVKHAAREVNPNIKPKLTLSPEIKVNLCAEIFAKLLLAGAEGIQIGEVDESEVYPCITSLIAASENELSLILETRLFKPGDNENQHRPAHKIIAEYCAADFIVKRIQDPSNDLTLSYILPVIAPNSVVRDDLRGLLGWMASLGNNELQKTAIELDAYAVLANGDPSQLEPSSKRQLLSKLVELEKVDPYFRRNDAWRRFSVIGLFTQDISDVISAIINGSGGHLRSLILELLVDSPAVKWLVKELRLLVLNITEEKYSRGLANRCLFQLEWLEYKAVYDELIKEGSLNSIQLSSFAIEHFGINVLNQTEIELFCRKCADLYDKKTDVLGDRYFIKHFIRLLNVAVTAQLLDELTRDLACTCDKKYYECNCRIGISKMVGGLLDHYFDNAVAPYESIRVWQWVGNLYFRSGQGSRDSVSVRVIKENLALREGILAHVFGQLKDVSQILDIKMFKFACTHTHAGLALTQEDIEYLVRLAFAVDNIVLWASFIKPHIYTNREENSHRDKLRTYMRKQANEKPQFMAEWVKQNRCFKQQEIDDDKRYTAKYRRADRRAAKRESATNLANIQYVNDNRGLVEGGKHWNCLRRFAKLVLFEPENIITKFGNEQLVRNALKNCLDFIEQYIPDMQELVERKCDSNGVWDIEMILVAASIEIVGDKGHLNDLKQHLLVPLKIYLKSSYPAISNEAIARVQLEVNKRLFCDENSREQFIRQYLEPQLQSEQCLFPDVHFLANDKVFTDLRGKLAVEWLNRFDKLKFNMQDALFDLAVLYSDSQALNNIILNRCATLFAEKQANSDEDFKKLCQFWFFRAFYFLSIEESEVYWRELIQDKHSIILFSDLDWSFSFGRNTQWPQLTAVKIEAILLAYVGSWPEVYLPSMNGNEDPIEERAYRFLKDIVWSIGKDKPDEAICVLKRLVVDTRFVDFNNDLISQLAEQLRKKAIQDFTPPNTEQVAKLIDKQEIVTIEGLRQLVLQTLINYQKDINGGEFNANKRFYNGNQRLGEVDAVEVIAERLALILQPNNITITPEHQTKNQNRIDITAAKVINGQRKLLVIEAKGQWHKALYSAADTQLYERYAIHPDAEHQGIYLVIWYGKDEQVARRTKHGIENAQQLKKTIEDKLSPEHKNLIDVFVLDVSK